MNALPAARDDGLQQWIAPQRAAVLVVDLQVDFASPEGALGPWLDMALIQPAIDGAQRLVDLARATKVPVIFVGLFTTPQTDSPVWNERLRRRGGDPAVEAALCRVGTRGADFVGPLPSPGDLVVRKTRYSGFAGTDLDARLKVLGVDTLIVAGLTTECCVGSTVADAFARDYHVFLATDAIAAYERDLHEVSLKMMELNHAILTDTVSVARAWKVNA